MHGFPCLCKYHSTLVLLCQRFSVLIYYWALILFGFPSIIQIKG
nr:MAG TPA: hypothetical protein [Caudoviricetes sp.]